MTNQDSEPTGLSFFSHIPLPDGASIRKGRFVFNDVEHDGFFLKFTKSDEDLSDYRKKVSDNISSRYTSLGKEISRQNELVERYADYLWQKCNRYRVNSSHISIDPDILTFDYFVRRELARKVNNFPRDSRVGSIEEGMNFMARESKMIETMKTFEDITLKEVFARLAD